MKLHPTETSVLHNDTEFVEVDRPSNLHVALLNFICNQNNMLIYIFFLLWLLFKHFL